MLLLFQILMLYNKKVTGITFHIDPLIDKSLITASITGKLDAWTRSVCPEWSRVVSTPYTVEMIPHQRRKRSLEKSKDRNQQMQSIHNWELDWILRH